MKKKSRNLLAMLLAFIMVFSEIPVYAAGETASEEEAFIEAEYEAGDDEAKTETVEEETEEAEEAAEEAADVSEEQTEELTADEASEETDIPEEEEMSLKDLAEEYDVNFDPVTASGYKIIFVKENKVTLAEDAEEKIAATGNDKIKIGTDETVTQEFDANSKDEIAPLVYENSGKGVTKDKTWKITVTVTKYYIEYSDPDRQKEEITKEQYENIINNNVPIECGHTSTENSSATIYFRADEKVSKLIQYANGGTIRLYPNWQNSSKVQFDEESFMGLDPSKKSVNPNADLTSYMKGDTIVLEPCREAPDGYTFKGFKYSFGDGVLRDAAAGSAEKEGKFIIETGSYSNTLTIYADWEPWHYKITYIGIKVDNAAADKLGDGDITDAVQADGIEEELEVMAEGAPDSISTVKLPDYYTAVENTRLPSAEEVNAGTIDPAFSEKNRFLCWSKSNKFRKVVNSLGKDGDIYFGDVVIYVIYTAREPVPEVSSNSAVQEKEFTIKQVTVPQFLERDSYAVFTVAGKGVSADAKSAVISGNAAEYFELCEVDSRWAELGHGYAAIGVKLKDNVRYEDALKVLKKKALRKGVIRIQSKAHETDEKGEPLYTELPIEIKGSLKLPKYKLKTSKAVLYTAAVSVSGDNAKKAVFSTTERTGGLYGESFSGEWTADFVVKEGKEYKPVSGNEVSVVILGDTFVITASKGIKGYIRLRNEGTTRLDGKDIPTGWIEGAYVYLPYSIKEKDKAPRLAFSKKTLTLNTAGTADSDLTEVFLKGGMLPDPDKLSVSGNAFPSGLSVEQENGIITVVRTGEVKAGSYKIQVSYEGMSKPANLKVSVGNTAEDKALKLKVKGKLDYVAGGNLFVTPKIKGFGGEITDAAIDTDALPAEEQFDPQYHASWNGSCIEIVTTDAFKADRRKRTIPLILTLTSGKVLKGTVSVKPKMGKVSLDIYDASVTVSGNTFLVSGNEAFPKTSDSFPGIVSVNGVSVELPVIATYTYTYYYDATTKVNKLYTVDLTTEEGRALLDIPETKFEKAGEYSGVYKDGVISLTYTGSKPAKAKNVSLSLEGTWKPSGSKCKAAFTLTVQ
ncbi:MAG: 30S ribosomal protein S21 [Lachnospiraceae bacterium]|nr:30S ribosomal protein S21 [Lachnospiraceae bacterium]